MLMRWGCWWATLGLLLVASAVDAAVHKTNTEWGNDTVVTQPGYPFLEFQSEEPFQSRDGTWLFWNSKNLPQGVNVSLYCGRLSDNRSVVDDWIPLGGDAEGHGATHLDAVPSMDSSNRFYWISTRDYPQNMDNVMTGIFEVGSNGSDGKIVKASHVQGDIYIKNPSDGKTAWIIMDQEINEDGSLLFYVNAQFEIPVDGPPIFANISLAKRNVDGSFSRHPRNHEIMHAVNNVVDPMQLHYAPSSYGKQSLELYFSVTVPDEPTNRKMFVAKRSSADAVFGEPEEIVIPRVPTWGAFLEAEAPTISRDGKVLMYNRMDCCCSFGGPIGGCLCDGCHCTCNDWFGEEPLYSLKVSSVEPNFFNRVHKLVRHTEPPPNV